MSPPNNINRRDDITIVPTVVKDTSPTLNVSNESICCLWNYKLEGYMASLH